MNERIHFPLAKLAATELFEALVAAQYDKKYSHIHRETIEDQFANLARELGYRVEKINAEPAVEAGEPPMFRPRPGLSEIIVGAGRPVRGASLEAAE